MTDETRIGLLLEPLDTLFFRDGRPFDAANRVEGGLPTPQTFTGALRNALLAGGRRFDFARFAGKVRTLPVREALAASGAADWQIQTRFRGPWLALDPLDRSEPSGIVSPPEPLLPVPQILVRREADDADQGGLWTRNQALDSASELPGWKETELGRRELLPIWQRDREAEHPGGFLTLNGIRQFLEGGVPSDDDWFEARQLYDFDVRTGIGIDMETLTSADGEIYGISLLALKRDVLWRGRRWRVVLYSEALTDASHRQDAADAFTGPHPVGGEGRYAEIRTVENPPEWPIVNSSGNRSLWLLATPGLFTDADGRCTWRPNAFPAGGSPSLKAAASGTALAVSGWDIARGGPKPTRFAVPAGAVYYVEGPFDPIKQSLCAQPGATSLEEMSLGDQETIAQGWGYALRGV